MFPTRPNYLAVSFIVVLGALLFPTPRGAIPWPYPVSFSQNTSTVYSIDRSSFVITGPAVTQSVVLSEAVTRYRSLIFLGKLQNPPNPQLPAVTTLQVVVSNLDETLNSSMIENLLKFIPKIDSLVVAAPVSVLKAPSVWGALRGLETFSQLVDYDRTTGQFTLHPTAIVDSPRFAYRGVMIDTARHFLPLPTIFTMLDAMSYNKFNVLHWHVVDDESYPFVSTVYPKLAQMGAFPPWDDHIYGPGDVQAVINYAYLRGIRVVPEFDTPGHFTSWTRGYPDLGTQCAIGGAVPVNPILDSTYEFMANFFGEVASVFPDDYLHLGGDELSYDCWANNTDIKAFMRKKGWGTNYARLETYYEQKLLDIVGSHNRRYIIWQLKPNTIVGVWKFGGNESWQKEMAAVTAKGFQAVLYAPWYLNYISYGQDWINYYSTDPQAWQGSPAQHALLIGGTACFWGEYIDSTNLVHEAWPRAAAIAERLWSPASVNDVNLATERLNAWRCVLIRRGIPAQPPAMAVPCVTEYVATYVPPWERD